MIKLLRGRERSRALGSGLRRFSRRWKPRPVPEITQNSVSLRGLPDAFQGLRVAQLSDIHHGIYTPLAMVERAVEETNHLRPDVAVLGSLYLYRTNRLSVEWDRLHDTQIYVSRGLGKSLVPFRIGCPPEIAMFEFRAA